MEEEGRLSEAWQSPLQRRLASDFDKPVHASVHAGRSPNESATKSRIGGAGRLRGAALGEQTHRGDARGPPGASDDGRETLPGSTRLLEDQANRIGVWSAKYADKAEESDWQVHGLHTYFQSGDGENDGAHDRGLRLQGARENPRDQHSCPLIYAVDAVTAKKHGLHLFQVRKILESNLYHTYDLGTALGLGVASRCQDLVGPNGTERGCSWSFVRFLGKNRGWVHAEYWPLPAKSVRTVTFCTCHDTTAACWSAISVHLHLQCSSPSNETYLCPFGRAVRSNVKKTKGLGVYSSSSYKKKNKLFFSGCMESIRFR